MSIFYKTLINTGLCIAFLCSYQVSAQQSDECTPEYIESVNVKCDSAEMTMQALDRNIASVAASQNHEGINEIANAQMGGLKAELDSFPTIAEGCQAIAADCMKTCAKYEHVCDKPKMQATSMVMQIGSMQRAYAQTQAVDRASEVQVAQVPQVQIFNPAGQLVDKYTYPNMESAKSALNQSIDLPKGYTAGVPGTSVRRTGK